MIRITLLLATLLPLTGHAAAPKSAADGYPNRPIRLILSNSPGSATDIMGRIAFTRMSDALGQQMVIDNRAGAGGTIGVETDMRAAPALTNVSGWATELASFKTSTSAERQVVTDLLRVGQIRSTTGTATSRSAIRFEALLRPSAKEWAKFLDGSATWASLPWVLGQQSANTGLRQSTCRIELQFRPGESGSDATDQMLPFFGAASRYYLMRKP